MKIIIRTLHSSQDCSVPKHPSNLSSSPRIPSSLRQQHSRLLPFFMCEHLYGSGCFSATLIPDLSWYSTSALLNLTSKLLQFNEVILQCSTLTKEDQYPMRVPAASCLEASATPTHCTDPATLLLTVSWLPATSHELQK